MHQHTRTALACLAALTLGSTAQAQAPQFKSGVELVTIDVQVVGGDGEPVLGLTREQFTVTIDGKRRPVVSVQFLEQSSRARFTDARRQPGEAADDVAAGAGRAPDGRIFILAVDENSFWTGHARAANEAARLFIDRLAPADYVGLATFPGSGARIPPTREHFRVREALDTIIGNKSQPQGGVTPMGPAEVFDITAGDTDALERVMRRACHPSDLTCRKRVQADAAMLAQNMGMDALQSLAGLRGVLDGLASIEGRKTVVLISGGLIASDRAGGRPDIRAETLDVGRRAASANTNLYVLHMDMSFMEAFAGNARAPLPPLMRDTSAFVAGLGMLAGAAGGQVFHVVTDADDAFDRVLRETSAYYLLGIEPVEAERDGRARRVQVSVTERGATVRSRNSVVMKKE